MKTILEKYDEIVIDNEISDSIYMISLLGKQFLIIGPSKDDIYSQVSVYLYNDDGMDFPHIMLEERSINDSTMVPEGYYRWICLYEQESIVSALIPYTFAR